MHKGLHAWCKSPQSIVLYRLIGEALREAIGLLSPNHSLLTSVTTQLSSEQKWH